MATPLTPSTACDVLTALAEQVSRESAFLGYHLTRYRRAHGLDAIALAHELRLPPEALPALSLCPTPHGYHRWQAARSLARAFGLDASRLIALLDEQEGRASQDLLAGYAGQRLALRGVVRRFGTSPVLPSLRRPTVLLREITLTDGTVVTDHTWLIVGRRLAAVNPQIGDVLAFRASVRPYRKGRTLLPDGTITPGVAGYTLQFPAGIHKEPPTSTEGSPP